VAPFSPLAPVARTALESEAERLATFLGGDLTVEIRP